MLRRLLTLLSAVSLLLCVAVSVLWVRSYGRADHVGYVHGSRADGRYWRTTVESDAGLLRVAHRAEAVPPARAAEYERAYFYRFFRPGWSRDARDPWAHPTPPRPLPNLATVHVRLELTPRPLSSRRSVPFPVWSAGWGWAYFPHWLAAAATAVLPAADVRRRRRDRRRNRVGLCPACGYDLRATPERCPECGAVHAAGGWSEPAERT